ncbi:hypothetical protein PDE_06374 [Penicillium oxalicum 114-2]|uniref:Uncharacterized protein n=1 Tax=Penicillium oxalicum (strain 114-2 / CGMCC 5302) TaxID=933388 RepID=S7ZM67_PENO1|nr:hypothetical protein PDE_06374 [Penicillium oxalicum 114-2]
MSMGAAQLLEYWEA